MLTEHNAIVSTAEKEIIRTGKAVKRRALQSPNVMTATHRIVPSNGSPPSLYASLVIRTCCGDSMSHMQRNPHDSNANSFLEKFVKITFTSQKQYKMATIAE